MPRKSTPATADDGWRADPRADRARTRGLDAARALLVDEGWEAVTHLRVAERSGLGRGTVYRHWPETADLVRDALSGMALALTMPVTEDLRSDLLTLMTELRRELAKPGVARIFAALVDRSEWDDGVRRIKADVVAAGVARVTDRLALAVGRGELAGPMDAKVGAGELFGPVVYRRFISGEPVTAAFITALLDDFFAAHGPH